VEDSLPLAQIDTKDFAGICMPKDEDKFYSLRYTEFIPLNTHQIQKLKNRVSELEDIVKRLEDKLNTMQNN
jgi:hypothetical protein